jgi:hypothetical protein
VVSRERDGEVRDMSVTEYDRASIAEARKLVAVSGPEAVRALTGDEDDVMAYAVFAGRLQHHLRDLLAIIDREHGDG